MNGTAKDNPRAAACVEAILKVLAEHNYTLGHEDSHGAFLLEPRDRVTVDFNEDWLRSAFVEEPPPPEPPPPKRQTRTFESTRMRGRR